MDKERLIQAGDIVIFLPPNGNKRAIKNLTIGNEYIVDRVVIRDSKYEKYSPTEFKSVSVPPHVDTIEVINDKGVSFSYSANHFTIAAEGVFFSLEAVEEKSRAAFMLGLKDL